MTKKNKQQKQGMLPTRILKRNSPPTNVLGKNLATELLRQQDWIHQKQFSRKTVRLLPTTTYSPDK